MNKITGSEEPLTRGKTNYIKCPYEVPTLFYFLLLFFGGGGGEGEEQLDLFFKTKQIKHRIKTK